MKIHIVGAGDVGRYLADELSDLKNDVVLIDVSSTAIAQVEEKLDVMTARGDATRRSLLKKAGAGESDLFVAVTGMDGVNILSCALAAEMGAKKTIARVDSPAFFLDQTGFERGLLNTTALACAPRLVSYELVREFRSRHVNQVMDFSENALTLFAMSVSQMGQDITEDLKDTSSLEKHGVCGVIRDGEFYSLGEIGGLYEGDVAILLTSHEKFSDSVEALSHKETSEKVIVVGGGDVGGELARLLHQDDHTVTLIDINRKQCEVLAESMQGISVIHGDGTNIGTLEEEGAADSKALFAVTKADEVNLMSSLLARDLGVSNTFALVHRPGYANVYEKLGVTATSSSHRLLFKTVDWMNAPEWVMRSMHFVTNRIEVAEIFIRKNQGLNDMPLSAISLPKGVHLLGGMAESDFIKGSENPTLKDNSYYIFLGPSGFSKDLDKAIKRARKD